MLCSLAKNFPSINSRISGIGLPGLEKRGLEAHKKAFDEDLTLKEAALKLNLISEKEFDKIVDPKKMI